MTMSAEDVAARLAITDKIYRYCRSVDRLDVPVGHSVFHEDSVARFPSFDGTGRGWIDYICVEHLRFEHHAHQVTNIIIDVDGDKAGSEAYVLAKLRERKGDRIVELEICARYVDEWSRRGGEWAIDKRECIVDFDQVRDVTPITDDKRGRRDRDDPSYTAIGRIAVSGQAA